jgi:hypothetical protein
MRVDLQSTKGAILLLRERIGSDDWLAYIMGIPNDRVFSPNAKGFSLNSVHGSRMRIFCGFCAKIREFVRVRLR